MKKLTLLLPLLCSTQAFAMHQRRPLTKKQMVTAIIKQEFDSRCAVEFPRWLLQLDAEKAADPFTCMATLKAVEEEVLEDMQVEKGVADARDKYGEHADLNLLTQDEIEVLKEEPRNCLDNCCLATFYRWCQDAYFLPKADKRAQKILEELNRPTTTAPGNENSMVAEIKPWLASCLELSRAE